ncbi:trypsin-like peptidase domain-containing protein [Trueperella sp. LYQ141]|uniref:S1C family serine protease n=1 Tax=Trueperella sp. LYQ141 TaxID=3391058 RepID=UPI003982E57E
MNDEEWQPVAGNGAEYQPGADPQTGQAQMGQTQFGFGPTQDAEHGAHQGAEPAEIPSAHVSDSAGTSSHSGDTASVLMPTHPGQAAVTPDPASWDQGNESQLQNGCSDGDAVAQPDFSAPPVAPDVAAMPQAHSHSPLFSDGESAPSSHVDRQSAASRQVTAEYPVGHSSSWGSEQVAGGTSAINQGSESVQHNAAFTASSESSSWDSLPTQEVPFLGSHTARSASAAPVCDTSVASTSEQKNGAPEQPFASQQPVISQPSVASGEFDQPGQFAGSASTMPDPNPIHTPHDEQMSYPPAATMPLPQYSNERPEQQMPWSGWEEKQAGKASRSKRRPGWAALIAVGLVASLVGAMIGVGVMSWRWGQARPASMPQPTATGTTQLVSSVGSTPDWHAVSEAVSGAVVSIDVETGSEAAAGSGFIIDADGHVLTNDHVVDGAQKIAVKLSDGRIYEASVVGTDESTDLAVLALKSPPKDLSVAQLGSSADLKVGQAVAAIGNPLGLSTTMTTGIISALDRPVQTFKTGQNLRDATRVVTNAIQIDAAVNPGNSGGPVFDSSGRVIGIASSIASLSETRESQSGSIGLGFAIPIDLAQRIAKELIEHGVAQHAYIGVQIKDGIGTAQGTSWTGAEIQKVEAGTPAEKAGLRAGDVVLKVNGHDVSSAISLTGYARQFAAGDILTLLVERNGELLNVDVTLATRADS